MFNNNSYQIILYKKYLNNVYTQKLLVRAVLFNDNNYLLVDNYTNFEIFLKNSSMSTLLSNNFKIGKSLFSTVLKYQNVLNPSLCFYQNSYFLNKINSSVSYLTEFYTNLKNFKFLKKTSFLCLKPIKGGYKCYSSGIIGFLPNNQLISIFNYFFFQFKNFLKQKYSQFIKLSYIFILKNLFVNLLYRFPLEIGRLSFRPKYFLKSYKKLIIQNFKKGKFKNLLNFVFLISNSTKTISFKKVKIKIKKKL